MKQKKKIKNFDSGEYLNIKKINDLDSFIKKIYNILHSNCVMIKLRDNKNWTNILKYSGKIVYRLGKIKSLINFKEQEGLKIHDKFVSEETKIISYKLWIEFHSKEMESIINGKKTIDNVYNELSTEIYNYLDKLIIELEYMSEYITNEKFVKDLLNMTLSQLKKNLPYKYASFTKDAIIKMFIKDIIKINDDLEYIIKNLKKFI